MTPKEEAPDRVWVQFAADSADYPDHASDPWRIRKWSAKPFEGATEYVIAPPQPSGEVERMRHALERLASPEAFIVSRSTTEEERARMFYAEAVLQSIEDPTAYAVRRARPAIGGRDE